MTSQKAKIISNTPLGCGIYRMTVEVPIPTEINCGQFVMISCGGDDGIVLKRPISIHDFQDGTVTLLYETVGKGTAALSRMSAGDYTDIILPLGNGFDVKSHKRIALCGGGLGIFPLYSVIRRHPSLEYRAYLGARDKGRLICDGFAEKCRCVRLATDDGSAGEKGLVTALLLRDLTDGGVDAVFACGPKPMLKALKKIREDTRIPIYVSMEERMGCGFGACLTCTCKTVGGNKRVCADGPVFDIDEVIL